MRILLDECLPKRLARLFPSHDVRTVGQMDWLGLGNGKLLAAADPHFDVFITVDKNLVVQQSIAGLHLAVILLRAPTNKIEDLSPLIDAVIVALDGIKPGQVMTFGT